jgi:drug/metabolite transporter (DMT)-like permease
MTAPPSTSVLPADLNHQQVQAQIKALIAVVIWGASFVATKIIVNQMNPLVLVPIRSFGGALLLFVLLKRRDQWTGMAHGRLLGQLALLGFIGVAFHLSIQAVGLTLTSASNTGWMIALIPAFIALLAWRFLGETFGGWQWVGFLTALGGVLLVVIARAGRVNIFGLPGTTGDGLVFLSAISWAVFSVISKRIISHQSPAVLMVHIMAMGCLMTLPLFFGLHGWQELAGLNLTGWLALAFIVLLVAFLGYFLWYDALAVLQASQLGVFLYIEPLVTVVVAAVLLGEPLRPLSLLGGAAIFGGVGLVSFCHRVPINADGAD